MGSKEPFAQYISRFFKNRGYEVVFALKIPITSEDLSLDDIKTSGLPECDVVLNLPEKMLLDHKLGSKVFEKEFFETRINPSLLIKEALATSPCPPKVFISFSSVGCYPKEKTHFYNEDDALGADNTAQLIQKWEQAAVLPENHPTRCVIMRLGIILSQHVGLLSKILPYYKAGLGSTIGKGNEAFPWIYAKDLYWLLDYTISQDEIRGAYNALAPQLINSKDFSKALASVMRKPMFFKFPNSFFHKKLGDTAEIVFSRSIVFPSRLLKSGFEFRYPAIYCALVDCLSKGTHV
ncbi:MAG: Epimerase family protein [Chlamydiae bacterium]|nr:Epimerase family protein [Chlamydiota bacterium]